MYLTNEAKLISYQNL